ncbi:FecCD family ABC transporter permease [Methanotorris formicicus]|uniref:Transport system permease protein n=1 Tax=Methanotorris formicicus Mc-S-70 TaxID=647171 RepID=H1KWV3_9EURY|nr:iron ABC transporter permease [Methanotorris formicicus]EHP89086.1 transport system permease protein [Methanotorris formicicus Mc-S-70]
MKICHNTLLFLLFLGMFVISLFIGRFLFLPWDMNNLTYSILFDVRLPRIIAVSLAGASLGLAGITFQNLFKNYLAGPGVLGVTSGSAFGAVFAILVFPLNPYLIQGFSFIFGIVAVVLAYKLGKCLGESLLSLILAGMMISAFFSALVGLAKYLADPYNKLPTIVFWLLGSFSGIRREDLEVAFFPMVLGIVGILCLRWVFNILSLGDEEAKALGVDVKKYRTLSIVLATLATSASTSIAGMITWVGVVSPHIARLVVGVDNRKLIPATAVVGASLLLICDDIARSLTSSELPLSVITSFIGAPILFIILVKRRGMYYVKD